ncbi:Uncharacterized protein OS=Candidatus Entotheonella sp. TSY1 GN=ETSY1_25480 PE=4 SV=1: DUF4058 [Gemmataceae bacterium]|nr:Uncharacterized protein OS=Candidatus Entotheonella sp. TSY1 GN=ETSY1_25480 PE=4 SV=1: DUF4058 [Gemmataceae bacterium]VTU00759.1 Uncharacterized protein OS=Candidatus Entotheonella sp. TSY1 GN=ETSY1_25480 PE=4 SV=1: DUF4058 [Gemmataceae bacterium]
MPLHDWTDERAWDSVHPIWMTYLIEWVQPRLPEGFKAFLGGVPALTVASANGKPDVSVRRWGSEQPPGGAAATGTAVLEPDAELNAVFRLDPQRAVHIDYHGQLIAAIEIVSPRNKDRDDAKETYTNRYLGYLRFGVHLMLVDVMPRPRKFSFADAISAGVGLELPPLPSPFAAVYRVAGAIPVGDDMGSRIGVWRRPLQVGEPLPTLPLPLSLHQSVTIDLEQTYQRAAERAYLT